MLLRCRFDFNLTDIEFPLTEMSLKQLLVTSYSKKLHKKTLSLQKQKIKKVIAKLFQIKSPIKTKKAFNIMKEYSRKLIVIAKNGAKQRMLEATVQVKQICENLKRIINEEHFVLIGRTT